MRLSVFAAVLGLGCAALFLPGAARAEEEKVLNVYNWSDYVAPDTLARFSAETGIKVNYDVYDNNEILSAKLMAGRSGYDVVFPSVSPHFANQVKAGLYRTLDRAKLANLGNIDRGVLDSVAKVDPGNAHGVPYMVAATGIGYNVAKVKAAVPDAPVRSWALLFEPNVAEKLKRCGVSLLDDANEVFPAALAYIGRDGASQSRDDLTAAVDAVTKVRPHITKIHSSQYINDLANGDLCVAHGYIGDLVQARNRAREAGAGTDIALFIPKEGAVLNVDVMAIPRDAPHPGNAHAFIDFMMRPDVIAPVSGVTGYASANAAAKPLVDEAIRSDPAIYMPPEVQARTFTVPPADPAFERERNRAWTRIKTRK